jgi:DNA-binding MarR family transcriptional regulator
MDKRLLARTLVILNACELDLLVFLHRHPRTLLTSEQLAGFVGYNIKDIAKALDGFIEAGLLGRTAPQSRHAARMFLLLLDGPHGKPVNALLELASTREGRQSILEALNARESLPEQPGSAPQMRLARDA